MTEPEDRDAVLDWFAGLSRVNQFAAAANPEDWAKLQGKGDAETTATLLARAHTWREFVLSFADEETAA